MFALILDDESAPATCAGHGPRAAEAAEMRSFRDRPGADTALRDRHMALKREHRTRGHQPGRRR